MLVLRLTYSVSRRRRITPRPATVEAMTDEKKPQTDYSGWGAGLAVGVGVGVSLGVALDNIGLGIGIGVALGMAFAIAFTEAAKRKREQPPQGD